MSTINGNHEDEELVKLLRKLETTEKVVSGLLSLGLMPPAMKTAVEKKLTQLEELIASIPPGKIQLVKQWKDRLDHLWAKFADSYRASAAPTPSSISSANLSVVPTKSISSFGSSCSSPSTKRYYASRLVEPIQPKDNALPTYVEQQPSSRSSTIRNSDPRSCYNCGLSGHLARDCPTKSQIKKEQFDPRVVASSSQTENEQTLKRLLPELYTLEQVVKKSLNTYPNSLVTLNDNVSMMVDLIGRIPSVYSSEIEQWNIKVSYLTDQIAISGRSAPEPPNPNSLLFQAETSLESTLNTAKQTQQQQDLNLNKKKEPESSAMNILLQELATLERDIVTILSNPKGPFVEAETKLCRLIEVIYQIPPDCVKLSSEWNGKLNVLLEQFSTATGGSTVAGSEFSMSVSNLGRHVNISPINHHWDQSSSSGAPSVVSTVLPVRNSPGLVVPNIPKQLHEKLIALETDCNILFTNWSYTKEAALQSKLSQLVDLIDHIPRACRELAQQWNDKLEGLFDRYSDPVALFDGQPQLTPKRANLTPKRANLTPKQANVSEAKSVEPVAERKPARIEEEITDETQQLMHEMRAIEFVTCKMIWRNTLKGLDHKLNRLEGLVVRIPANCPILLDLWRYKFSILLEEYHLSKMAEACMADDPEVEEEVEWMDNKTKMEIRQKKIEIADRTKISLIKAHELSALRRATEVLMSVRPLPIEKLDKSLLEFIDSVNSIPPHCVGACNFYNSHVSILLEKYGILKENPNADVSSLCAKTVAYESPPEEPNAEAPKLDNSIDELEQLTNVLEALKEKIETYFGLESPPMDRLEHLIPQLRRAIIRIPSELTNMADEWNANLARYRQRFSDMSEELNKINPKDDTPKTLAEMIEKLNNLTTLICQLFARKPLPNDALERNLAAMAEVVEMLPEEEVNTVDRWNDKYYSLLTKLSYERCGVPLMTRPQIEARLALVLANVPTVINDRDVMSLKRLVQFAARARQISLELTSRSEQYDLQDTVFGWMKDKLPESMLDAYLNQYEPTRKKYLHSLISYLCQRVTGHFAELNGNDYRQQRQHYLCFNCFEYGHGQKYCQNESASVEQLLQI